MPERATTAPSWLTAPDEFPHDPTGAVPTWAENYLSYVWSPGNEVGIYLHLSWLPASAGLWDEQLNIALPGDRYVTAKGFSRGRVDGGPQVCGAHLSCDVPFERWTKRFCGAGRVVGGDEYRAAPVRDGAHVPVEWELTFEAMSPPFDFGAAKLDQEWAHGHYEQHGRLTGWLRVGDERHEIHGTGLRDHSWGPRDYRAIGTTTWLHAQFPESGRSLMAVHVTGLPPKPAFSHAVVGDRSAIAAARATRLPVASTLAEAEADYGFRLELEDGSVAEIEAEILNPLRAGLVGPGEIGLGTYDTTTANHHYIDAFTRFRWDGEVGFGITERSVDLQDHTSHEGGEPHHGH